MDAVDNVAHITSRTYKVIGAALATECSDPILGGRPQATATPQVELEGVPRPPQREHVEREGSLEVIQASLQDVQECRSTRETVVRSLPSSFCGEHAPL